MLKKQHTPTFFAYKYSNQYRYGFNGMEKDDEVHGVTGSSYDFGARMYDPRLGRWFSTDPQAKKQPGWSPYKAFYDNPVLFVDPDGETEYITITVNDERTGKSISITVPISEKVMTDGVKHMRGSNGAWYYENDYYDYTTVTTINIDKDGNYTSTTSTPKLLRKKGAIMSEGVYFGGDKNGDTESYDDPYAIQGGIFMSGSGGQGTKFYSKNDVESLNVDELLAAVGGGSSAPSNKFDQLKNIADAIGKIGEVIDAVNKNSYNGQIDGGQIDGGGAPQSDSGWVNTPQPQTKGKDGTFSSKGRWRKEEKTSQSQPDSLDLR